MWCIKLKDWESGPARRATMPSHLYQCLLMVSLFSLYLFMGTRRFECCLSSHWISGTSLDLPLGHSYNCFYLSSFHRHFLHFVFNWGIIYTRKWTNFRYTPMQSLYRSRNMIFPAHQNVLTCHLPVVCYSWLTPICQSRVDLFPTLCSVTSHW